MWAPMSPHAFFSLFLGFQVHVQYVPMRCSGAWRDLHDWLCSTLCTRGQLDHWAMPQRQQHSASWHIVLLPALFCSLELFSFFFKNMLNNWKMLYDCYWLVPVNSLKSSQQNSQIKASFFCLETWVSLFIAAQPRDRMVMWSEPTCICPEPDAQQGYAQDDLQTYHSEWDISSLWFPCFAFSTAF